MGTFKRISPNTKHPEKREKQLSSQEET